MTYYETRANNQRGVKEAVLASGVLETGHFIFADGDHSLNKLEMDNLWRQPEQLDFVLYALSSAEGLPKADLIMGVPTGGQRLVETMLERDLINIPMARIERVPGGGKKDFRFCSAYDEELALMAQSIRIYEDVVTTLSSVAGVVRILRPDIQDLHTLAIWRRGKVKDEYRVGITDHYLVEEELPSFSPTQCPICLG